MYITFFYARDNALALNSTARAEIIQEDKMTEFAHDPEDILSDFLRVHLTDPKSRAETTDTDTHSATSGQTEFTVSPPSGSVSCLTSVTVEGTAQVKWKDYVWDYQNSMVTFASGLTLSDAVIFTFKYGSSNWIYSDRPNNKLSTPSFPRISIFCVSGSGIRLGNSDAPILGNPMFQIDCWARENDVVTIGSKKYSNNYLSRYLGYQIIKAFEDNESDLFPALWGFIPVGLPRAGPYSNTYQAYHTIVEAALSTINPGRVTI